MRNYGKQVDIIRKKHRKEKDTKESAEFLSGFKKADKLKPVITLTIYFGTNEWDGPRSLKEMFEDINQDISKYINDYKLNLIIPKEIKDFQKFKSEFGKVMKYIALADDNKAFEKLAEDEYYGKLNKETVRMLNECVGETIKCVGMEDGIDMCKALEDMRKEAVEKIELIIKERATAYEV